MITGTCTQGDLDLYRAVHRLPAADGDVLALWLLWADVPPAVTHVYFLFSFLSFFFCLISLLVKILLSTCRLVTLIPYNRFFF